MLKESNMITLTPSEFGPWIVKNLKDNEFLDFALEKESENEYTAWWFAKWINFEDYCSRALYIDYCGGGHAYVIPFDGDYDECLCNPFNLECQHYFTRENPEYNWNSKINIEIKESK